MTTPNSAFPRIISVDDHVVEGPTIWTDRLPAKYRDIGPHVVRQKVGMPTAAANLDFAVNDDDDGLWADVWHYESKRRPITLLSAAVGHPHDEMDLRAITFDDMLPGCYDPRERVKAMELAGVEAAICFPNVEPVRFCGQGFLEGEDRELALLCVKAYNDWMLDEWCAGSDGRLIPLGIMPLWSPELAALEIRRCAALGMKAMCFSELPSYLGLPSIHTDHWHPVWRAAEETETVLMLHIGSSSRLNMPSPDAPAIMGTVLLTNNVATALTDWVFSGVFETFQNLKVCLAECQIGWIPYYLQQCDEVWNLHKGLAQGLKLTREPSSYYRTNMYVSAFNDEYGLANLDWIGADRVLCETDYPHSQTTWPDCLTVLQRQTARAGLDAVTVEKIVRGNAKKLFRL